jgi:hypothetical protein
LKKYGAQGNDVFPRMDNGQGKGGFKKMMGPRENMFPREKMDREDVSLGVDSGWGEDVAWG